MQLNILLPLYLCKIVKLNYFNDNKTHMNCFFNDLNFPVVYILLVIKRKLCYIFQDSRKK